MCNKISVDTRKEMDARLFAACIVLYFSQIRIQTFCLGATAEKHVAGRLEGSD